jgi:hypothetical protein
MDQLTTLLEIIKETIKINNYFYKRFLEKKGFYNFGKKHNNNRKKYKDLIKLDIVYRKP